MTRNEAIEFVKSIVSLREGAHDEVASVSVAAYPTLKGDGELIKAGTRIKHNGILLRASVDLYDTEENNPENAPTLWEELQYKDGYRIIPKDITVGTAFSLGEKGWWTDGSLYESLLNANVHTPEVHPAGWKKVE